MMGTVPSYSVRRTPIFAQNIVATSQPLAVQAGVNAMRRGGNAVDAALATAIALTVVEPNNNGLGSDAFAQIWDGNQLHGLNGSGRAPAAWSPERFTGRNEMPVLGWDSVTVPGAVSAWKKLSDQLGKLPFGDLISGCHSLCRRRLSGWSHQRILLGFIRPLPEALPGISGPFRANGPSAPGRRVVSSP